MGLVFLTLLTEDANGLKRGSFRFFFYSDEQHEPPHIHVAAADGECKFWLDPVKLERNKNLRPHTIREIE